MKVSHLNGLRALEATLRRGTFSAAAEELGVTVAAVGQQLRGLEDYLGVKLFERLPSGAQPLPEARAIAERLTAGFTQIEDVLADLRAERDGRRVTLTMTHHFFEDWMSERLPRFYACNSAIEVRIDTSDRLVDLAAENVDMAIRFSPKPGPAYQTFDLWRGYYLPVCSPEFADTHRLGPDSHDLTSVPLFVLQELTTDPEWLDWHDWMGRFGLQTCDGAGAHRIAGRATATSGAGLVLIPLIQAFNDLANRHLVAPLGRRAVQPSSYRYRLIWPAARSLTRAMRAFRDWMATERDQYVREASQLIGVDVE